MSLIILLPGETCPTAVDLALVRWGRARISVWSSCRWGPSSRIDYANFSPRPR